jgi:WD40 repeat protein
METVQRWTSLLGVAWVAFGPFGWINRKESQNQVAVPDPKVVPFTSFPGDESEPAFSSEGDRIAFVWRPKAVVSQVFGGSSRRWPRDTVLERRQAGLQRDWTGVTEGIYFATAETPSQPMIEFFHFATGKLTRIATLDKPFNKGLSLSPDGRWLIYTQEDRAGRDIMLMENFR